MSRAEELRAELALLEMEADFVAAKEAGAVTPEMKTELREARREFREMREGAAAAAPEPIQVATGVATVGG